MIARTQLAILDFNCGSECQQATTKDGTLRYKQVFSKITQTWVVKKITAKKDRLYLSELLEGIQSGEVEGNLPDIGTIRKNIAPVERPDKTEAISNMRSRFKHD